MEFLSTPNSPDIEPGLRILNWSLLLEWGRQQTPARLSRVKGQPLRRRVSLVRSRHSWRSPSEETVWADPTEVLQPAIGQHLRLARILPRLGCLKRASLLAGPKLPVSGQDIPLRASTVVGLRPL